MNFILKELLAVFQGNIKLALIAVLYYNVSHFLIYSFRPI